MRGNSIRIWWLTGSLSFFLGFGFLGMREVRGQANPLAPGESAASEEVAAPDIDPDLASPRDTLITFLKGIEAAEGSDDAQQWEKVYKTLEIPDSAG